MSEERFHHLRAEIETLGQADEAPSHMQIHEMEPVEESSVECRGPSRAKSSSRNNTLDSPPASEQCLEPPPEEKATLQHVETAADRDVAMPTGDDRPAEVTTLPPTSRQKSKRGPRTSTKPVSQHL